MFPSFALINPYTEEDHKNENSNLVGMTDSTSKMIPSVTSVNSSSSDEDEFSMMRPDLNWRDDSIKYVELYSDEVKALLPHKQIKQLNILHLQEDTNLNDASEWLNGIQKLKIRTRDSMDRHGEWADKKTFWDNLSRSSVTDLDISEYFHELVIEDMINCLLHSKITHLSLTKIPPGEEEEEYKCPDFAPLFRALPETLITHLSLNFMPDKNGLILSDTESKALAQYLPKMKLTSLSLSLGTDLTVDIIKSLPTADEDPHLGRSSVLKFLSLSYLKDKSIIEAFIRLLPQFKHLKEISIEGKDLSSTLKQNTQLLEIINNVPIRRFDLKRDNSLINETRLAYAHISSNDVLIKPTYDSVRFLECNRIELTNDLLEKFPHLASLNCSNTYRDVTINIPPSIRYVKFWGIMPNISDFNNVRSLECNMRIENLPQLITKISGTKINRLKIYVESYSSHDNVDYKQIEDLIDKNHLIEFELGDYSLKGGRYNKIIESNISFNQNISRLIRNRWWSFND